MCCVTFDFAGIVEQVVVRRHLTLVVYGKGPVVEIGWAADEIARGDHRVGVKRGEEQCSVEAVHAAAEAREAVEDVP